MLSNLTNTFDTIVSSTNANWPILAAILIAELGMFILTVLSNYQLLRLGLVPRQASGLMGIITTPFLHASFNHLFFNLIPLLILSNFILISGANYFYTVSFYIIIISGILTWIFARPALHVGASGVITGFWAFLVMDLYTQGGLMAIILGIISIYYFAGIFFGIFPQKKGVSWEGHLFGLIAGVLVNYFYLYLPITF